MNNVVLVGRLTRDPNVRYTANQMCVARFTVACNRSFRREGQPEADFISCVAFGKTGEFIEKYFTQGSLIGISGSIQTGSYDNKDGQKVYTTDVLVDRAEFVGSKADNGRGGNGGNAGGGWGGNAAPQDGGNAGFPEGFTSLEDDDMPF